AAAEIFGALLERRDELARRAVGAGHLGGEEDLRALEAGAAQRLAAFALGVVALRRVEMPVAQLQGVLDGLDARLAAAIEGAEADGGNIVPVRQRFASLDAGWPGSRSRPAESPSLPSPLPGV